VHVQQELGKLTEQEDGNLTRMVVESLKHEKEMIEERPNIIWCWMRGRRSSGRCASRRGSRGGSSSWPMAPC
jgi:hypothetical protein